MIALPIDLIEPYHDLAIALDGTTYNVHVRYSTREQRYYLHVYDTEGEPVAIGVKVLCEKALLKTGQRQILPGQFYAHSNTIDPSPPMLGELGLPSDDVRVNLYYIPLAECLELEP